MSTFIDEAEVKRVVNYLIREGTPTQMKELTQLMRKRSPWSFKKKSLKKIIAKHGESYRA